MKFSTLVFLGLALHYACAQEIQQHQADSLNIPPGTARVIAEVIAFDDETSVALKVIKVIGTGHGMVNILSEGQEIKVPYRKDIRLKKGEKIEADLRERIGIDASQSSYVLLRVKKAQKP